MALPTHLSPLAAASTPLQRVRLQQQVVAQVSASPAVRQGDVLAVCQLITGQVAQLLGIERVSVWLFNTACDELICQDLYLLSSGSHSSGAVLRKAEFEDEFNYLLTAKHLDAHDPYTDPRTLGYIEGYLRPNRITAMLDAVVRLGEELIGTVCLEHVDVAHRWSDDEIVFSSQLGDQVALTLSVARTREVTEQLQQRDRELQALNEQLEQRVQARTRALQHTQSALMESERLAALGGVVAGVAHELSTPLGNARMGASTLFDQITAFAPIVESGRLGKSALMKHMAQQQACAELINRNLESAAALIEAFKSVSVDQSSGARRAFALHQVVHDVLETLSPSLQRGRTAVEVEHQLPTDLLFDSYPGPLGQVLANLVNNALLHAFEGRDRGQLRLQAQRLGEDRVVLVFADDGVGIPADLLSRIFEPFFTTKFGRGGSGLGLHLVYNWITKTLGGQISVRSKLAEGTAFRLELPLRAPA